MKISVAQTKAVTGDIQSNIENHLSFIELSANRGADLIIFPELSLTGYESILAANLAANPEDGRLEVLQEISSKRNITVGVGIPLNSNSGITISMILFHPAKTPQIYSKKYLHPDEERYFISGESFPVLKIKNTTISFAICHELSIPKHFNTAIKNGTEAYITSVAKTEAGVNTSLKRLSEIAGRYFMPVFMANCVGKADGEECAGKSSIWNSKGELTGQLNNTDEGLLIFDMITEELIHS